jgi:hypothetical protein
MTAAATSRAAAAGAAAAAGQIAAAKAIGAAKHPAAPPAAGSVAPWIMGAGLVGLLMLLWKGKR